MALSQLMRCLETGEHADCIRLAEQLLMRGPHPDHVKARILHALGRSKLALADYLGAIEAGEQALPLARRLDDSDLYNQLRVDLGSAYLESRHYDRAVKVLRSLLEQEGLTIAPALEAIGWEVLGRAQAKLHNVEDALQSYRLAHSLWHQAGEGARTEQVRHRLADLLIKADRLDEAAELLTAGEDYCRSHPEDVTARCRHRLDQAEWHFRHGAYAESVNRCLEALELARGSLVTQYHCYLLLYRNALAQGHARDALGFAFSARVAALDCGRFDLEFEAAEAMFDLIREQGPELVQLVESHYAGHGLDIYQYIPDSVLRRKD